MTVLSAAAQTNWPQLCGEQSLGVATHQQLPATRSAGQIVACKPTVPGIGWSSPWGYDDKISCLSKHGDMFVFQAGPEHKLIGKNSLGEMGMAPPAMARDSLTLRTPINLYRIKNPETRKQP